MPPQKGGAPAPNLEPVPFVLVGSRAVDLILTIHKNGLVKFVISHKKPEP